MALNSDDSFREDYEVGKKIIVAVDKLIDELNSECTATRLIAAGKIREISQQYTLAAERYQKVEPVGGESQDIEAMARLALVKLKTSDLNEGLALARSLVEKASNFTFQTITGLTISSQTVLGDALRLNGEARNAAEAYEKSIKITDGKDIYSISRFASLSVDEGDVDRAISLVKDLSDVRELSGLTATVELLSNDSNRLPAIKGILANASSMVAADICI